MDLSYIINHLGEERAGWAHAVSPPIWQTTMFAHPTVARMREAMADEYAHHVYTRGNNPTTEVLRRKLAALEGAADALVFGSGAAAVAAAVLSSVRAGDHVVAVDKPYAWTRTLLKSWLPRFGVAISFVDARSTDAVAAALRDETRLIVLESPNSLTFEQQDLAAIAALAAPRGIRTICDNSYATPLGQSPLAHGIDVVVHSATKYLAGHSDVLAGAVCASEAICREIFAGPYMTFGAILAPHDAWLVLRGLRTFPLRMERIAASTAKVVAYLRERPEVARLHYPHDAAYPQRELTQRQLAHAAGLFSIELAGGIPAVERFCDALQRFLMSASWGGHESLCFPVAGVRDWRGHEAAASVPVSLVRLSIGLEDPDVLIADLAQALARI
ncbi:MAG TPA: PLP-dependent aspartate aminotransferase family protein [Xanthomonadales bacterium]|nr:PLP-dependent aspartate aminotransferase family protein [Xanthomonadales bacterium]